MTRFSIQWLTRARRNLPRDWSDSASCQSLSRAAEATCKLCWFPIVRDTAQDGHYLALVKGKCRLFSKLLSIEARDRRLEREHNISVRKDTTSWAKLSMVANLLQKSPNVQTYVSLWKTNKVLEQSELCAIELNANEPSCNDALPCMTTTGQGL